MPVVEGGSPIGLLLIGIGNEVVGSSVSADRRTPRKQFGVDVKELGEGVASLELQAVPHPFLGFQNQRVVVGADCVRAVIESRVKRVRTHDSQTGLGRYAVASPIVTVQNLQHRQMAP